MQTSSQAAKGLSMADSANTWTTDAPRINDPETLARFEKLLEIETPLIIEHKFYRGGALRTISSQTTTKSLSSTYKPRHDRATSSRFGTSASAVATTTFSLAASIPTTTARFRSAGPTDEGHVS